MSQVTLLSLDISSSSDVKGASSHFDTELNGQAHEFSKMFQRQVNAEEDGKPNAGQVKTTSNNNFTTKDNEQDSANLADNNEVDINAENDLNNIQPEQLTTAEDIKSAQASDKQALSANENSKEFEAKSKATTVEQNLTDEQLLLQQQLAAKQALATNQNDSVNASAENTPSVTTVQSVESPIDFLTRLSASESLLTGKTLSRVEDNLTAEQKAALVNKELATVQEEGSLVKQGEISELAQKIQQALKQASPPAASATNKHIEAENLNEVDNVQSVDESASNSSDNKTNTHSKHLADIGKAANGETSIKPKLDNAHAESIKLKPDVIQAEQAVSEKKLAELTKTDVVKEPNLTTKNKTTDAIAASTTAKQTTDMLAKSSETTAKHPPNEAVLAGQAANDAKAGEQISEDIEAELLSRQEKSARVLSDKNSAVKSELMSRVIAHKENNAINHTVNNKVNKTELAAMKQDGNNPVQQVAEQEQSIISSEENKAAISQVVAQATNATKASSQESNKTLNANLAQTTALESTNKDEKSAAKAEVVVAESELLFDKNEQSMLTNTVKSAQQFTWHQTASTTSSHAVNEATNTAQLEAISNKQIADNVQQVKNNQIQLTETINIHRKDFVDSVKDKVLVMINQKIQQVDIKLDPPELGNVQVRVNLQGDAATVNFVVQNPQAKEALEQQMGKLRDMLNESGVDVGEANVEQQNQQQQDEFDQQQQGGESGRLNQQNSVDNDVITHSLAKGSPVGIDFYA